MRKPTSFMMWMKSHISQPMSPDTWIQPKSAMAAARPIVAQLRGAQAELGQKLLAPGPVQAADLQPLLQRIGQLRAQLAQDSATAALEVRAVLTPEQLARVAQTKERLSQLREEMRLLLQPPRQ